MLKNCASLIQFAVSTFIYLEKSSNYAARLTFFDRTCEPIGERISHSGAQVEEVYVYESGLPVDKKLKDKFFQDLTSGKIDAIVFGSGLSAKNIFKMLSEKASMETLRALINSKVTTVAIGPTTAEALREMGINVDVMPQDYLFEEALTALARYWER
ncbi:MAG: uroporphyrinogen-III synthase [Candidatus Bathyarchaeia archaeon]